MASKKRRAEEAEAEDRDESDIPEALEASRLRLGLQPKDPTEQRVKQYKVAKVHFDEACDELTRYLRQRISEYSGRINTPTFKTKTGHMNLRPEHFIKELQKIRKLIEYRDGKRKILYEILREGYDTDGSFSASVAPN